VPPCLVDQLRNHGYLSGLAPGAGVQIFVNDTPVDVAALNPFSEAASASALPRLQLHTYRIQCPPPPTQGELGRLDARQRTALAARPEDLSGDALDKLLHEEFGLTPFVIHVARARAQAWPLPRRAPAGWAQNL
jgi:hypothetical protein